MNNRRPHSEDVDNSPRERQPFEPEMIHVPAGPFLMGTSDRQVDRLAQNSDRAKKWHAKATSTGTATSVFDALGAFDEGDEADAQFGRIDVGLGQWSPSPVS